MGRGAFGRSSVQDALEAAPPAPEAGPRRWPAAPRCCECDAAINNNAIDRDAIDQRSSSSTITGLTRTPA